MEEAAVENGKSQGGSTRNVRKLEMSPAWVAAVAPESGTVEWRDSQREGLSLRVTPSGKRTWYLRYSFDGKERRFRLGGYPAVKLASARELARKRLGQASNGVDPQRERERLRVGDTVAQAVEAWLSDQKTGPAARWKGGLHGGSARSFLPHIRALVREKGARKLAALSRTESERFVSAPATPATRNRRLQAMRFLFSWAKRKGLVNADPTEGLAKDREQERTRTLTDAELKALVHGFDETRYGRAVRLLALTGLRRDEVLGARWEWYDATAATLTIPADVEKAGKHRGEARKVALSPAAQALLGEQRQCLFAEGLRSSPFIFATQSGARPHPDALKPILYRLQGKRANGQPASTHPKAKRRQVTIPEGVTLHDIRRTVGDSLLNRLGVSPWIVDHVVMGHVRPKIVRTYMPNLPLAEARDALTKWSEILDQMLSGGSGAGEGVTAGGPTQP